MFDYEVSGYKVQVLGKQIELSQRSVTRMSQEMCVSGICI